MLSGVCRRTQSERLPLDDVERLVEEHRAAHLRRLVGHRFPAESRPDSVGPLNGPVQNANEFRAWCIRGPSTGGERLRPRVADHHRRADRHAPETATVPLTERLCLLEELLCALLIDLSRR